MAVIAQYQNITGLQALTSGEIAAIAALDEFSFLIKWAGQATTGTDMLFGVFDSVNTLGFSSSVSDVGGGAYTFTGGFKGDTLIGAGVTASSETNTSIASLVGTTFYITVVIRSSGTFELYVNDQFDDQIINPAVDPISGYGLDLAEINRNASSAGQLFTGTTAAVYVIDRVVTSAEHDAWAASETVPGLGSPPVISSVTGLNAGETATFTTQSAYATPISSVTINGVSQSNIAETAADMGTFTADDNGFLPGSSVNVVVTDANGASDPYSATYNLPTGFTGVTLTSVGVDAFSGVAIGDHLATDSAKYVAQADGSIGVVGSPTNGDVYNVLLYDASDSYAVYSTEITVEASGSASSTTMISNVIQPLLKPLLNNLIR